MDFKGNERSEPRHDWFDKAGKREVGPAESDALLKELFSRVQKDGICQNDDIQGPINRVFRNWQFPMYDFDLSPIIVTQEELEDEQASLLRQEMGYHDY